MTAALRSASDRIARYIPTVDTFLPCLGPEEKRLRCGILYIRDKATAAVRHARREPAIILQSVVMIASEQAYATMPIEQVRELRHALVRLMMTASALEERGPGSVPDEPA
ncbi:hypothetical protein [Sphingomonas aracearum]|uniref:Uncharacterized protein n=1 Tax=Sphingomonas aracearum TaxID=2283317 RepID=A0A369VV28_9SPHN|nr:hypothetical protein [Sphingomonas aracearum]RDE06236.1 hypothetical protein DVW87_00410 [Sphingomonas aracearum]